MFHICSDKDHLQSVCFLKTIYQKRSKKPVHPTKDLTQDKVADEEVYKQQSPFQVNIFYEMKTRASGNIHSFVSVSQHDFERLGLFVEVKLKETSAFLKMYTREIELKFGSWCTHEESWCNGYCHWKWTWQREFKSWISLIAFHKALGKGMNLLILPPAMGK